MKDTHRALLCCGAVYRGGVVLPSESVDEIIKCDQSSEAIGQYFLAVLFIMLYN